MSAGRHHRAAHRSVRRTRRALLLPTQYHCTVVITILFIIITTSLAAATVRSYIPSRPRRSFWAHSNAQRYGTVATADVETTTRHPGCPRKISNTLVSRNYHTVVITLLTIPPAITGVWKCHFIFRFLHTVHFDRLSEAVRSTDDYVVHWSRIRQVFYFFKLFSRIIANAITRRVLLNIIVEITSRKYFWINDISTRRVIVTLMLINKSNSST